jgi:hypothetical protein
MFSKETKNRTKTKKNKKKKKSSQHNSYRICVHVSRHTCGIFLYQLIAQHEIQSNPIDKYY